MWKTSTYLAYSTLKWFKKVRGGSLWLNHSERVYRYPTHLVPPVKMRFEKVHILVELPRSHVEDLYIPLPIYAVVPRMIFYLYNCLAPSEAITLSCQKSVYKFIASSQERRVLCGSLCWAIVPFFAAL